MKHRKLSIAWSIAWGVLAVLEREMLLEKRPTMPHLTSFIPAILVSTIFAVIPWVDTTQIPRFSLRTLLIATMLVAVGLGVVVWLRK